jgi:hypothetical protein
MKLAHLIVAVTRPFPATAQDLFRISKQNFILLGES